jgi:NifB/MoaA-like Fe-S oxidoreductase
MPAAVGAPVPVSLGRRAATASTAGRRVGVLTGEMGAAVLAPLMASIDVEARILEVENRFFGGNIGVSGLMVGEDVARVLAGEPEGDRYLLPDVCLSGGRFLDGMAVEDLPRPVEVLSTDGVALRRALEAAA